MPTSFTAFNSRNRDAGAVYNSASAQIPDNEDTMVKFTITNFDIVNEPSTTVINWIIEASTDNVIFEQIAGGQLNGLDGQTPPKPPGNVSVSIGNRRGQWVRGSMSFQSANDQRKRFGVSGETY
jgi:hypothetical protein